MVCEYINVYSYINNMIQIESKASTCMGREHTGQRTFWSRLTGGTYGTWMVKGSKWAGQCGQVSDVSDMSTYWVVEWSGTYWVTCWPSKTGVWSTGRHIKQGVMYVLWLCTCVINIRLVHVKIGEPYTPITLMPELAGMSPNVKFGQ